MARAKSVRERGTRLGDLSIKCCLDDSAITYDGTLTLRVCDIHGLEGVLHLREAPRTKKEVVSLRMMSGAGYCLPQTER